VECGTGKLTDFKEVGEGSFSSVSSAQMGEDDLRIAFKEPKPDFQEQPAFRDTYRKVAEPPCLSLFSMQAE
jgi:hypothetical protein